MKNVSFWCCLSLCAAIVATGCEADNYSDFDEYGAVIVERQTAESYSADKQEHLSDNEEEQNPTQSSERLAMIGGKLYRDTGMKSKVEARCGTPDGMISSAVDSGEIPTEDNQSNFGSEYDYQYWGDGVVEIKIDGEYIVFEQVAEQL